MEILFALFVLWIVVTLVGHLSWVILRTIFRLLIGQADAPFKSGDLDDVTASHRGVRRLLAAGLIDEKEATRLHQQLRTLADPEFVRAENAASMSAPTTPPPHPLDPPAPTSTASPTVDEKKPVDSAISAAPTSPDTADETPIIATLRDDDGRSHSRATSDSPVTPTPSASPAPFAPSATTAAERQAPVISKSEIIQSFLAAHNIRWGELAAGILIVVCSIGLVISLWSPLVERHRVMPSLIFLGANAAIYAAGLYTLAKWRLRHTSRAVLVIATLLVPLSVLAGLAAAGTAGDSVRLNDPITVAAIAVASVIYSGLLLWGGRALTRCFARQAALAVAGPVVVLPMIPAAVRTLGIHAGWCFGFGSLAVVIATCWMIRSRRRVIGTIGLTGGRNRILVMAFGGFALAVSIGYGIFTLRSFGLDAYLPIAIAILPALVGLVATGRTLTLSAGSATHRMIGTVTSVLLVGISWTILPAAMSAPEWLWAWAIVLTVSGVAVGWIVSQPRWLPASTLPLGLATILSSPWWLGGNDWEAIPFWTRFFGGEPMLAATLVAIVVAVLAALMRDPIRRRWMIGAACFWTVGVLLSAGILAVAPESWLGIARGWHVTVVLGLGAVASSILARRQVAWSAGVVGAVFMAWCSVLRPLSIPQWKDSFDSSSAWMITLLSVAATLMVLRELVPRLIKGSRRTLIRSTHRWSDAAIVVSLLGLTIACLSVGRDWSASSIAASVSVLLLFWSSTALRSANVVRLAQLASVATAVIIGYGRFNEDLFGLTSWKTGHALWAWALGSSSVAALWVMIREVACLDVTATRRRFGFLNRPSTEPFRMLDGPLLLAATGLIALAAARAFASLLGAEADLPWIVVDLEAWLPLSVLAASFAIVLWIRRHVSPAAQSIAGNTLISVALSAAVWLASYVSVMLPWSATGQLILAATLAAIASTAIGRWLPKASGVQPAGEWVRLPAMVSVTVIATASGVLLNSGWVDPVFRGLTAEWLPTVSVSAWWLTASALLLWTSRPTSDRAMSSRRSMAIASALLTPMAVALLVPVFSVAHPIEWLQYAGLASLGWVAVQVYLCRGETWEHLHLAGKGSFYAASLVALVTMVGVLLSLLLGAQATQVTGSLAGVALCSIVVSLWCFANTPMVRWQPLLATGLPWPIGLTLLAGQGGWILEQYTTLSYALVCEIILGLWLVASAGSAVIYRRGRQPLAFWHAAIVSILVMLFAVAIDPYALSWFPWVGLAAAVVLGGLVALVAEHRSDSAARPSVSKTLWIPSRIFGWTTIVLGIWVLHRLGGGRGDEWDWTLAIGWTAAWTVAWRLLQPDRDRGWSVSAKVLPDAEFAILLMGALLGEWFYFSVSPDPFGQTTTDVLLAIRGVAYAAVAGSALLRGGRNLVWEPALTCVAALAALIGLRIALMYDASNVQRTVSSCLVASFIFALNAYSLPLVVRSSKVLRQLIVDLKPTTLGRVIQANARVVFGASAMMITVSIGMIAAGVSPSMTQLMIVAVGLLALTMGELAELGRASSLRFATVWLVLITIGLLASVDSGETAYPWLSGSMRWLVASVVTTPMTVFVIPRLIGSSLAQRWQPALQRAGLVTAVAAFGSLLVMLSIELIVRTEAGISGISNSMVIGVAVTLAILSLTAALAAILSYRPDGKTPGGPISVVQELSDSNRRGLIVAAQAIAGITWLHVFLCKTEWAFVGLRDYWPYTVMAIAFASVGATEWAKRRGDRVLSETIRQTALYLPLIPVIGFWVGGVSEELAWMFDGGKVRYDLLLAAGSIYYLLLAAMWKQNVPRVGAILLGNAALWVVLAQRPDWAFLVHPQAWIIPPAVCVLVVAHLYRRQLPPQVLAATRYASTLVIYVSSTADMLLQQIGTNLAGPIVLVLLALTGMLIGVVLQVRPFLYLGTLFILIGVTSMVWHAQRSIDAVWPWWVFGISTGICLLAGLMALEKNKDKLRRYAQNVTSWQG